MSAIAIDFGTSNTVVCVRDPVTQQARTLAFDGLSRTFESGNFEQGVDAVSVVPTLVVLQPDGTIALGEQVRSQRLAFAAPDRAFQAFKRELVADFQPPPRIIGDRPYSSEQVAELFLEAIWTQIQTQIQPSQVILTLPVGSFERYLDWFRAIALRLQLPNVQLVDESTAAALGYAVREPGSLVLLVDFGGGTLDLSLVRTQAIRPDAPVSRAEVLAKSDAYVGGVDIDQWLVEHTLRRMNLTREAVGAIGWQNLLEIAEKVKIRLSHHPDAIESWLDDETFTAYEVTFTQAEFNDLLESQQLLEQIRQAIDEVLTTALSKGIRKSDIEHVLLVGGSSQIPAVQNLLMSYFGRSRVRVDKPFEAVAQGALVLSQLENLDDYLRHSYAIRLWDPYARNHSYYPLFAKGIQYPCRRSNPMLLQVANEGQQEIRLDIGEVADITQAEVTYDRQGRMTSTQLQHQEQYRSLNIDHENVCVAHLDPPGEVGVDRVSVQFEVDAQRVLIATVKDLLTGKILVEREAVAKLR